MERNVDVFFYNDKNKLIVSLRNPASSFTLWHIIYFKNTLNESQYLFSFLS